MTTRSRSHNSSLVLDHLKHYGAQARRKLSNSPTTAEPNDISLYKSILKSTKHLTPELEQIANNLYLSQIEQSTILRTLSNKLTNLAIQDSSDKFSIFLNNMGRVYQQTQDFYDIHLINMKDELINPLNEFNINHIEQCQSKKLQLKTTKAQYDINKKNDEKIKKLLDERFPNIPDPPKKQPKKRSKSVMDIKTDNLAGIRKEFIDSVSIMMAKRMQLMQTMQHFMSSFEAYSTIHSQNIQSFNNMSNKLIAKNNNNSTNFILKEGYFKKHGHKKYFKLYKNKKLVYMIGLGINGTIKGYIDLNKIFDICKKNTHFIQIQTLIKTVIFEYDTIGDRDDWFHIMQETVGNKKVSILQVKKSFEETLCEIDESMERNENTV